jgi:hypothetical protein
MPSVGAHAIHDEAIRRVEELARDRVWEPAHGLPAVGGCPPWQDSRGAGLIAGVATREGIQAWKGEGCCSPVVAAGPDTEVSGCSTGCSDPCSDS